MAEDLETFIRQQKAKLLEERQLLEPVISPRNNKQNKVERNGELKQTADMPPQRDESLAPQRPAADLPAKPPTPQLGLVGKLGQYEQRRKKLMEERNNEYNRMMAVKSGASKNDFDASSPQQAPSRIYPQKSRVPSAGDNPDLVNMPGMRVRQSAEARQRRLKEERQQEYNTMLAQKKQREGRRPQDNFTDSPHTRKAEETNGAMPGLRNHPSAEQMKTEMRNREYNNFLRQKYGRSNAGGAAGRAVRISLSDSDDEPRHRQGATGVPAPRRGWATPTYEETLQQKRLEERRYRKYDDPELYNGAMRASLSDGNLNKSIEADNRYRDVDPQYDTPRRVRFEHDRPTRREQSQQELEEEFTQWQAIKHRADPIKESSPYQQKPANNNIYGTSLPLAGHDLSESEAHKRKQEYSDELRRQIEQTRKARTRNFDADQRPQSPVGLPAHQRQAAPVRRPDVEPYSHRQPAPRVPRDGILDRGWDGVYAPSALQRPRLAPESGYTEKPRAYSEAPALGSFKSSLDEAYHYYGMTNLLDPNSTAPYVAADNHLAYSPHHQNAAPNAGMERDRPAAARPLNSRSGATSMLDVSIEKNARNQKDKKATYQAELLRQIEEQKEAKRKEREEQQRYDQKIEDENRTYDPFGKGGAGAAMRDHDGNLITNLRDMHLDNEQKWRTPDKTTTPAPGTSRSTGFVGNQPCPAHVTSPRQVASPQGDGEKTFARGGHGIFGDPMSDVQKTQQQRYQDDLRKQIEEKKRHQEAERQQQKLEDEKLMQRIAEENQKMEEELENERRKEREKLEKAQQLRDEQKRLEEEKRKTMEQARKEEDERRQEEARRKLNEEAQQRQAKREAEEEEKRLRAARNDSQERRPSSPPVPAIKNKSEMETTAPHRAPSRQARSKSPPVRAPSRESRPPSSDVLSQLARMRQQLQSERRRVEQDLKKTREEPEVFDPRLSEKPPIAPQRPGNVDVFDVARNREAVTVRRPHVETNEANLQEFNHLKNKANSGSRTALRNMYPDSPTSGSALEEQQRALLKQQEQSLRRMKKSPYENANPRHTDQTRASTASSTAMLESESAFIAVENGDRNYGSRVTLNSGAPSRQQRQRSATPKSPTSVRSYMTGSVLSLNPEKINSKNEERMRKLKMATDRQSEKDDPVSLSRVGRMQQRIDVLEEVCSQLANEVAKAVDLQTRRLLSETTELSQ